MIYVKYPFCYVYLRKYDPVIFISKKKKKEKENLYQHYLNTCIYFLYRHIGLVLHLSMISKATQFFIVSVHHHFKDAWSYFSKFSFLFHLKNHQSKGVNIKFQLKRSSRLDVPSNLVYIEVA